MNTIQHINKQGDRLYLTLNLDGLREIELKLYVPYPKESIFAIIDQAVNHNTFANANYNDEEDDECEICMHGDLVQNILAFFEKNNMSKVQIIGIYDKNESTKFKLTELGKKSFVYYTQDMVSALDWTLTISQNIDEALYAMTSEMMSVSKYEWSGGTKQNTSKNNKLDRNITYSSFSEDIFTGKNQLSESKFLISIDSIEEFLKYKSLTPTCIEILVKSGMIESCENNEFWEILVDSTPKKETFNIMDSTKTVDNPLLKIILESKN